MTRDSVASDSSTTGTTTPVKSSVTNNTGDNKEYGSACADARTHARIRGSTTATDVTLPSGVTGFTFTMIAIIAVAWFHRSTAPGQCLAQLVRRNGEVPRDVHIRGVERVEQEPGGGLDRRVRALGETTPLSHRSLPGIGRRPSTS